MFSTVFVFQVFQLFKVPKKFRKNYIKNQRDRTFRKSQKREGGHHQGPRRVPGAAPPWAALGGLLAALWVLPTPPFAYIYPSSGNPRDRCWECPLEENKICFIDHIPLVHNKFYTML